jgi:hypothetical protein
MAEPPRKDAAPEVPGWFGAHPMGDVTSGQFRLSFNPQLRVELQGATVTSDAGLLLLVENPGRLVYLASIDEVSSKGV